LARKACAHAVAEIRILCLNHSVFLAVDCVAGPI
jgi:hypothetical protein